MHAFDWGVIGLYLLVTLVLGLYFTHRAGSDLASFFASSRQLTWLFAGVSMIATSFASDTPLWITTLIRQYGLVYVWQYWAPALGGTLAVVLFARMWRRLGVITDLEMLELRYAGRNAAALRGTHALLTSLLFCPLIIGWVTKAMEVITRETLGVPEEYRVYTTLLVIAIALASCALSGLWGVVYTDFFQFILAVIGTSALAWYALDHIGGLDTLRTALTSTSTWVGRDLALAPAIGSGTGQMSVWNAIGYFGLLWMHVAYSGGFQAQRVLACKDTRHASLALLTLCILYYGFICWPWILTALCSIVMYPDTSQPQDGIYPRMIMELLPVGLKGILITAMLAAFMSTISTLFNWGSSYLVNDFYKRFMVRDARLHHYVNVGRVTTVFMAALGAWISFQATQILQLVTIAFVMWAGLAVIGIMRWLWWRMTAAGELAATILGYVLTALIIFAGILDPLMAGILNLPVERPFSSDQEYLGLRMLIVVVAMVVIAVLVSYLTKPEPEERLLEFLKRGRPLTPGWRGFTRPRGITLPSPERIGRTLLSWAIALASVYGFLFAFGWWILGRPIAATIAGLLGIITLWITIRRINRDHLLEEKIYATEGATPS